MMIRFGALAARLPMVIYCNSTRISILEECSVSHPVYETYKACLTISLLYSYSNDFMIQQIVNTWSVLRQFFEPFRGNLLLTCTFWTPETCCDYFQILEIGQDELLNFSSICNVKRVYNWVLGMEFDPHSWLWLIFDIFLISVAQSV
jgi:hypothetical protein